MNRNRLVPEELARPAGLEPAAPGFEGPSSDRLCQGGYCREASSMRARLIHGRKWGVGARTGAEPYNRSARFGLS